MVDIAENEFEQLDRDLAAFLNSEARLHIEAAARSDTLRQVSTINNAIEIAMARVLLSSLQGTKLNDAHELVSRALHEQAAATPEAQVLPRAAHYVISKKGAQRIMRSIVSAEPEGYKSSVTFSPLDFAKLVHEKYIKVVEQATS